MCQEDETPLCNITGTEYKALQSLKKDEAIKISPAAKGRASVILDTEDYDTKMQALLSDTNTYTKLSKDPTPVYEQQLINIIKTCHF